MSTHRELANDRWTKKVKRERECLFVREREGERERERVRNRDRGRERMNERNGGR